MHRGMVRTPRNVGKASALMHAEGMQLLYWQQLRSEESVHSLVALSLYLPGDGDSSCQPTASNHGHMYSKQAWLNATRPRAVSAPLRLGVALARGQNPNLVGCQIGKMPGTMSTFEFANFKTCHSGTAIQSVTPHAMLV